MIKLLLSMKALGPKILKVSLSFFDVAILYKENRIVGIMLLAELQERIRSINVFKDEEKGSLVSEN
jgi:exonuclease SbcC